MEREHSSKHTETYECHREEELLPSEGDGFILDNLKNVPCQRLTLRCGMIVYTYETKHQESRTTHEHKCKLHG